MVTLSFPFAKLVFPAPEQRPHSGVKLFSTAIIMTQQRRDVFSDSFRDLGKQSELVYVYLSSVKYMMEI